MGMILGLGGFANPLLMTTRHSCIFYSFANWATFHNAVTGHYNRRNWKHNLHIYRVNRYLKSAFLSSPPLLTFKFETIFTSFVSLSSVHVFMKRNLHSTFEVNFRVIRSTIICTRVCEQLPLPKAVIVLTGKPVTSFLLLNFEFLFILIFVTLFLSLCTLLQYLNTFPTSYKLLRGKRRGGKEWGEEGSLHSLNLVCLMQGMKVNARPLLNYFQSVSSLILFARTVYFSTSHWAISLDRKTVETESPYEAICIKSW